ncbi:MAG: LysM peptidoglycan-binding domain-containing protein [Gammaproteobacteria bacterium]|nr:LysM peptidoglycan-binding domain-containing protein [Gammaproteobacteria bacterium]
MSRLLFVGFLLFVLFCCSCSTLPNSAPGSFNHDPSSRNNENDPPPHGNLWNVLAGEFNLPDEDTENPAVRSAINWYIKNPIYLQKIAAQAKPYLYYVYQEVKRRDLPSEIVLLPMVESNYDPFARSSVGAMGLWQMMPGTALGFGLKQDWWYDGRRDIIASTNSALDYLVYLGKFFHGDWLLAIAAYDTGEGTVRDAIRRNLSEEEPIDFWHLWLPRETQNYIPKLLALATIIKYPYEFGIQLTPVDNAPYLEKVKLDSQIDLAQAAKLANISLKELAQLNPGFNRWATDPDGPHVLLLPIDKVALFKEKLAKTPKQDRVTWIRHKVEAGDSLIKIAHQYQSSVSLLKQANHLTSNEIHIGKILLVPKSAKQAHNLSFVKQLEHHYLAAPHEVSLSKIEHYVVKKGDTLWEIAKKFNVKSAQLRFWNRMKGNEIHEGQHLSIWTGRVSEQHLHQPPKIKKPQTSSKKTKQPQTVNSKRTTYRVKTGDTLESIARKYHTTVDDITRWNNISDQNHLKLDQILVIYS